MKRLKLKYRHVIFRDAAPGSRDQWRCWRYNEAGTKHWIGAVIPGGANWLFQPWGEPLIISGELDDIAAFLDQVNKERPL